VLEQVRTFSHIPIIILTVSNDEVSIVRGLELGADDYVVKPFKQLELLARIKTMLRRGGADDEETPLAFGSLKFNPVTRQASYQQQEVSLTPTEGRILYHLLKHPGRVVSHSSLAEAIWGNDYPGAADNTKVYIWRLREKMEQDPSQPQLILTKAGTGYYLAKID
jgi:two-component system KDP operon response regulator KdpE